MEPDKRLLWGCVVALVTLLGCSVVTQLFAAELNRELVTPVGAVPMADVFAALLAMAAGGAVARRRFRWIALALIAVVWVTTLVAVVLLDSGPVAVPMALALKYNAPAIGLSAVAAWVGAVIGETLATRHASPRPA